MQNKEINNGLLTDGFHTEKEQDKVAHCCDCSTSSQWKILHPKFNKSKKP